ncbi:hypothetical protein JT06_19170 [Desulfobulbus sp. Tol-SR]|nr:hypothetical protein JT06_19170 [Desulfobulbus sp. Tol-SR]
MIHICRTRLIGIEENETTIGLGVYVSTVMATCMRNAMIIRFRLGGMCFSIGSWLNGIFEKIIRSHHASSDLVSSFISALTLWCITRTEIGKTMSPVTCK